MDRRSNCYLNTAYNRNIDDFDDYIDTDSQLSFDSKGQSYESENETYVDEYLEDYNLCYSEENQIAAVKQKQQLRAAAGVVSLNQTTQPTDFARASPTVLDRTSTPKKQLKPQAICSPSGRRLSQRRTANLPVVRSRSVSMPRRTAEPSSELSDLDAAPHLLLLPPQPPLPPLLRRSKSSLSLGKPRPVEDPRLREFRNAQSECNGPGYVKRCRSFQSFTVDPSASFRLQRNVSSVSPFQIRERDSNAYSLRRSSQSFLRRPYDLNSSFSSSRPLVTPQRNTAIISPIYKKSAHYTSFDMDSTLRNAFTIAADRSISPSKSWMQPKKQTIPLCTLRTSAVTLLVSGTLSCLLCIHLIWARGKSYEINFSLIAGFVALCLGFPCLRFQEWQWLPNRNYVSGYVVLSLFSVMQTSVLWVRDKFSELEPEVNDLIKGVLYALSSLSLGIALLGVCTSCCCKYPPPDNRVTHGVQGFTV